MELVLGPSFPVSGASRHCPRLLGGGHFIRVGQASSLSGERAARAVGDRQYHARAGALVRSRDCGRSLSHLLVPVGSGGSTEMRPAAQGHGGNANRVCRCCRILWQGRTGRKRSLAHRPARGKPPLGQTAGVTVVFNTNVTIIPSDPKGRIFSLLTTFTPKNSSGRFPGAAKIP